MLYFFYYISTRNSFTILNNEICEEKNFSTLNSTTSDDSEMLKYQTAATIQHNFKNHSSVNQFLKSLISLQKLKI
jgi:hypothetical protein